MNDFSIHRGSWAGMRDQVISKIVTLEHAISDQKRFLKLVGSFRHEHPEFDFDAELNAVRLYYIYGNFGKVREILQDIKVRSLNVGKKMLVKRMSTQSDMGKLGELPIDVLEHIMFPLVE